MEINLLDYQNRTDSSKRYARHLFRSAKGIQAAEHNEVQDAAYMRLKSVSDTLYSDGYRVEGCDIGVDLDLAKVSLGAGKVYINAEVHPVAAASIPIPLNTTVVVGVWYTERIVTEIQDGTLRDPAVGTANYQQPGAARLQIATFWGLSTETHANGQFYALYIVSDGVVVREKQVEPVNQISDIVARYDYDSNGSFVIEGFTVRALPGAPAGKQSFSISEGRAHVLGYEVIRSYAQRLVLDEQVAINEVEAEEHIFNPDQSGSMRINVRHTPIELISMVKITRQRTVSIVHGTFTGARDPLPNESVVQIISVKQNETVYTQGADYKLTEDTVDWSPYGAEIAPGSTYTVTYQYRLVVTPENPDPQGFSVSNSVAGQLVQVRYSYRLPRVDILVLNRAGDVYQICGVPHRNSPVPPSAPNDALKLATVIQRWEGLPEVVNYAIRVTSMRGLELLRRSIIDIYDLTAQNRMMTDAILSAPSSARGLFVDSFANDNMRDAGIAQSAAVVFGELMLPLDAEIMQAVGEITSTLDFVDDVILHQPARTGSMKINPYQAQEPLPARITLEPSVDRWDEVTTAWTSSITERIVVRTLSLGLVERVIGTSQEVQVISSEQREGGSLRRLVVKITGDGFGPNETFSVTFDGLPVTTSNKNANAQGVINATFTIPAGIPAGTKQVVVTGSGGTRGSATYTGTNTVTTETRRTVTTIQVERYDPLAQTFTLDRPRHVSGAEVWFTKKGTSEVRIQIRDVLLGYPNRAVLAEGRIQPGSIQAGRYNRIEFDRPVLLSAGTEYALVVLTDTGDHELAIAELGQWDLNGNAWLTRQAYQTGVLLSSSNAQTWTAHQTMDLCFKLLGARFVASKKVINLGNVTLGNVTDLLPLAEIEYTSANTEATFVLKSGNTEVARIQPGQTLSLTEKLSGVYTLLVELSGEENLSPVLYSGVQLIQGKLRDTADYVSRAFPCGADKQVLVTLETLQPGSSNVQVYVQTGTSAWTEATLQSFTDVGDNWRERTYAASCSKQETRVKIILTGSPSGRPRARLLRTVVIDD